MNFEAKQEPSDDDPFTFAISLSVLNHLGRNLYRSFITVLGEAISNSWDANSNNVWITIDRENDSFFIKDDGDGMDKTDFQKKFLKIGYSKRTEGEKNPETGRPYIGRKGIGKLALLSCAEKVSVISKVEGGEYVGGVIDNSGLDDAIKDDLEPNEYILGTAPLTPFKKETIDHEKGTIIYFEGIKEGIRNRTDYLRKVIALYFRFSLVDSSFNIFLNGEPITLDNLEYLAEKTEFLWVINNLEDPYVDEKLTSLLKPIKNIEMKETIEGFIASVEKPGNRKIPSTDEKVTIDLFVNGRLRETDLLKHIPTERVVESYLYGQIHVDDLDDEKDRFTSSREGVVAEDPKFKAFLEDLKEKLHPIFDDWDKWRHEKRKTGDPESPRLTKKERSSVELYNAVSEDYTAPPSPEKQENQEKVNSWVDAFADDAKFNFTSYAECFISENLIRKYIQEEDIEFTVEAERDIDKWKEREKQSKARGNISIEIRENSQDSSYLSMEELANLVDKTGTQRDLVKDSKQYKPIRDGLMHTALLTDDAKSKLTTVYANIKGRLIALLSN
jgi:hypothetical protein